MKTFTNHFEQEYNGYIIYVYNEEDLRGNVLFFKIREQYLPGKWKTRRVTGCNQYTGRRDQWGNKIYTSFDSPEQALERAKNYIDNHIVAWINSPHYKLKS